MTYNAMEFNVEAAADSIGSDLFPSEPVEAEPEQETVAEDAAPAEAPAQPAPAETPAPVVEAKPVPKSWPKEMHEHWGKVDPKVQEYWEAREKQMLDGLEQYKQDATFAKSLKDVLTPYQPILKAQGLSETTAVQSLLNAHYRLTQGTQEARLAAYQELGRNLGLAQTDPNAPAPDPKLTAIEQQVQQLQQSISQREQAALQEAKAKIAKDVETFASDPAHPYFEDVADDMMAMLHAGHSLQEAYDKAVWANPVTRAKEQSRLLTEHEAKLKENARLEALPKQKAKSVNIKSRDTGRAPTEPLGSWEDTMRGVLAARNSGSN